MFINEAKQTIGYKIVYYGAAMSGKTSNVRYIAARAERAANEMLTLETRGSRTLYFDMVRLTFGRVGPYRTYFNLYTTPGQTVYITSRRLVLAGADAVVFVMDSQQTRLRDNAQSWYTLERQLLETHANRHQIPIVIQLNKRDMPYVATREKLLSTIKVRDLPVFEASAEKGQGVIETLQYVIEQLSQTTIARFQQARAAVPVDDLNTALL